MEEYLSLYHQKLWEIAFTNVINVFISPLTIFFLILIYISFCFLERSKKRFFIITCTYFVFFIISIFAEYLHSYDKITDPDSIYNNSLIISSLTEESDLLIKEYVDDNHLASIDGGLKKENIILLASSNPTYYGSLFGNAAIFLSGGETVGKNFLIALVGYEEKGGEWQSVDIRIAPGAEAKDFQKFSEILYIEQGKKKGATSIILNLQRLYERKVKENS